MFRSLYQVVLDLFTERDGKTWDYMKVIGTGGLIWWMATQTYDVLEGHAFSPNNSALGLAGLLTAVGGGIAMRSLSHDTTATPNLGGGPSDEKTDN